MHKTLVGVEEQNLEGDTVAPNYFGDSCHSWSWAGDGFEVDTDQVMLRPHQRLSKSCQSLKRECTLFELFQICAVIVALHCGVRLHCARFA